ncbi:MAG: lipid-A-disaccharide synthase N-terminal domain-containing protein [Pseudomonadota bacterium]|nr:lipid-A-disaccharide synthase N-terminal domain-containing protein [Pseudomonadota bacterium]
MDNDTWWLLVGFGGQGLFMLRLVIQCLHSERQRLSVIPVSFWYLSVAGALVLLAYAVHRRDPAFIAGQLVGVAIYLRNLALIRGARAGARAAPAPDT